MRQLPTTLLFGIAPGAGKQPGIGRLFRARRLFGAGTLLAVVALGGALPAQTPAAETAASSPVAAGPSELLKPSLDMLQQTLNTLRVDKWKCAAGVRDETEANINSIRTDLGTTLPTLLATADAAPASLSSVLPVFRNVDALYDVLLRVRETGEMCAPRPQSAALEQAMTSLEGSRRTLGDRLQDAAVAQEQKLLEAQAALRARPVPVAAPAPVETPRAAAPASHPVKPRRPKPKAKPTPPPPATPQQ